MGLIKNFKKYLFNIPGWRTNRKIVVFESDDWGSTRMPSRKVYEKLNEKGLSVSKGASARYNLFDTLASADDLSSLFEVLGSVKDKKNEPAKFTAVSLVANPDFDRIKRNIFREYYYEPFTKTLERYNHDASFDLWKEGIESNLFVPEFHGREHLNVQAWLRALQNKDEEALIAFNHGVWGYNRKNGEIGFQAAFDLEYYDDLQIQKEIMIDGINLFQKIHSYNPSFFVPPNGPLNNDLEKTVANLGIRYISTPKLQKETLGEGKVKKHFRYLGKKNKHGQTYITRNGFFEPSGANSDQVANCLNEIQMAFKWKKPAIISTHRVNYIGVHDEKNRISSLNALKNLLKEIVKRWPDVEFMTSSQVGDLIKKKSKIC